MTTTRNRQITDPQQIRALAHPVRLRLMDLLGDDGPLSATQCAALTGQTVANCSFHLRTLAKYGYVEPAERTGREKPWQLVGRGAEIRLDPEHPEAAAAAVERIATLHIDREVEHVRRWLGRIAVEPHAWVDSGTVTGSTFWATAAEMAEVSETLQQLVDRFEPRATDPAARPTGARPIRLFATTVVDVAREERTS